MVTPVQQFAVQQPAAAYYAICSQPTHDFMGCPQRDAHPDSVAEQGGEQQVKPPFPPPVHQLAAPARASWEIAIDKLAEATCISLEQSNQNLQKIQQTMNQNMQNMQASITNLERQFGQLASNITEREQGKFPNQTVPNPRGTKNCCAIRTLRFRKSYDNRDKEKNDNRDEAVEINNIVTETTKKDAETVSGQISNNSESAPAQKSVRVYDPPLPYPESKKRKLMELEEIVLTGQCSVILLHKLPPKKKDPGSFTISCTIGNCDFSSVLIDLGASINLMPYSIFKRLGEGKLKLTSRIIQLADHSITYPRGVIEDVIVKVDNLFLPADFMVLDMGEDLKTPIILGRPFMATALTLIDVEAGTLTLKVQNQLLVFNLFEATKQPAEKQECMRVDTLDGFPRDKFMTRSTDHLSIKPPNFIQDCIGPKPKQQRVLHDVQPIDIKKKVVTRCKAAKVLKKYNLVKRRGY
nr:uncharacterized protein LOC108169756 [Malus domestica]